MTNAVKTSVSTCMDTVAQARNWVLPRLAMENPWNGLSALPQRPDGTLYTGTNILLLWMQQEMLNSHSPVWGSGRKLEQFGHSVKPNEQPQKAVFFQFIDVKVQDAATAAETTSAATPADDDDSPGDMDAAGEMKRIRILKPIELFNLVQTDGFNNTPPPPFTKKAYGNTVADFHKFWAAHLLKWKALPENLKRKLSAEEEAYLLRFSTDLMLIGNGHVSACDLTGPYPSEAIDAMTAASPGRMMKLAGISQEFVKLYNDRNGITPAPSKKHVAAAFPVAKPKTSAPSTSPFPMPAAKPVVKPASKPAVTKTPAAVQEARPAGKIPAKPKESPARAFLSMDW